MIRLLKRLVSSIFMTPPIVTGKHLQWNAAVQRMIERKGDK